MQIAFPRPTSATTLPLRSHNYSPESKREIGIGVSGILCNGIRLAYSLTARMAGLFTSVWGMLVEVVFFWQRVRTKTPS